MAGSQSARLATELTLAAPFFPLRRQFWLALGRDETSKNLGCYMIGQLQGVLLDASPDGVICDVGGVGYELEVPASTLCRLPERGKAMTLYVHTYVREDALRLFGFISRFDRAVFQMLIQVSNVGPKLALTCLGPMDGAEFCSIIRARDADRLVSVPGIGRKTADRIVLELEQKALKLADRPFGASTALPTGTHPSQAGLFDTPAGVGEWNAQVLEDVRSALANLGYKEKQVSDALKPQAREHAHARLRLEDVLREALKRLSPAAQPRPQAQV